MPEKKIKWTGDQLNAINSDGTVLVSAAAGSGKTAVLAEHVLKMIPGDKNIDVDRLLVLTFTRDAAAEMKRRIQEKGLRLVVADLPTTYQMIQTSDSITHSILELINNMLIDLLATMARLDNEKRIERIKQGLARSGYKPTGKKANEAKHKRIKELLVVGNMTKEEIAKAVNCGVATVYRVAKVI